MEFVVFLGVAGLIASIAGLIWWFSDEQKARRLLAAHPICPIGELRPGDLVRIRGAVRVLRGKAALLSGERCAAFHVKVEEKHGKNSWRLLNEERHAEVFEVVDATGSCRVDPRGSQLFLTFDAHGNTGTFDNPSPAEAALLEHFGLASTSFLGLNRQLRMAEAKLSDTEEVTLLGRAEIIDVDGVPSLAVIPDAEHGLVVTDRSV